MNTTKNDIDLHDETLESIKANHPIVSGFHSECHICKFIDQKLVELTKDKEQKGNTNG